MNITCTEENAEKFADWLAHRGGIAHWKSLDLSNPGMSWSSPALNLDGSPFQKPNWRCPNIPDVVTDINDVTVVIYKEFRRFHVAVKQGSGMAFVCTDASSRRIEKALEKAGENSTYCFDYDLQEAVILCVDSEQSLSSWLKEKQK